MADKFGLLTAGGRCGRGRWWGAGGSRRRGQITNSGRRAWLSCRACIAPRWPWLSAAPNRGSSGA